MRRWTEFCLCLVLGTLLLLGAGTALAHGTDISDDMHQVMTKMMTSMERTPMSGDPDRDFAAMMVRHHQGAIDMANLELKYGKDAEMRKMAQKTINDQTKEIGQLNAWIKRHPAPAGATPEHRH